jgi:8-oxo-dGTP pyrophosphatase MutT (NUDIX family)
MITDQSYGIIPVQITDQQPLFLLVYHQKGHWAFPKGHAEESESPLEAAIRELREETNLQADIQPDSPELIEKYWFTTPEGEKVSKTVTFFLGLIHNPEVVIQEVEIQDYAWLTFDQALEKITFPAGKQVLKQAADYLEKTKLHEE